MSSERWVPGLRPPTSSVQTNAGMAAQGFPGLAHLLCLSGEFLCGCSNTWQCKCVQEEVNSHHVLPLTQPNHSSGALCTSLCGGLSSRQLKTKCGTKKTVNTLVQLILSPLPYSSKPCSPQTQSHLHTREAGRRGMGVWTDRERYREVEGVLAETE